MSVKIVAGLGNPGPEYRQTPHNVGFEVVELLAVRLGGTWRASARFQARLARATHAGATVLLVQPMTYMNLSGTSVAPVVRYHGATAADLAVVSDDADLPVGRIRIRAGGRSGGHRGLASVIETLGTEEFVRVRIGVGRSAAKGLKDHVLGRLDPEQAQVLAQTVTAAAEAVMCWMEQDVTEAMNRFNGWAAAPPDQPPEIPGTRRAETRSPGA